MERRVTLLDIAQRAKCCKATVSMALKGSPRLNEATRKRICALALEMGYRPDPLVSSIAQQRWQHTGGNTVAYVYNDPNINPHDPVELGRIFNGNQFFYLGTASQGEKMGYTIEPFNLSRIGSSRRLEQILKARGIRGILLGRFIAPHPNFELNWSNYSAVSLSSGPFQPEVKLHHVNFSAFEQVEFAIRKVISLGYKRIGITLLRHDQDIEDDRKRWGAIAAAQRMNSATVQVFPLEYPAAVQEQELTDLLRQWYGEQELDAVIGFNSSTYWHLTGYMKVSIPDEVGFAELHANPMESASFIDFSGVRDINYSVGKLALRILDVNLRGNETGVPAEPFIHHVTLEWMDGVTMPPRR
ncbi:MAG: LacI family DNA-binding transcriptional regulator [Verrucomicrobiota bacterium]|nr:LacI family DNA-binding transcriptional regulator [Verrucomicrobiota bacterium]